MVKNGQIENIMISLVFPDPKLLDRVVDNFQGPFCSDVMVKFRKKFHIFMHFIDFTAKKAKENMIFKNIYAPVAPKKPNFYVYKNYRK